MYKILKTGSGKNSQKTWFKKGHAFLFGGEKGWFKKGQHPSGNTEFKKGQVAHNKGVPVTEAQKEKIRKKLLGFKHSEETRKKMRRGQLIRVREGKHNNYKRGITTINHKIRSGLEYRLWRESVFKRDDWTCIWCGLRSGCGKKVILHADHIKPFSLFPELRFAIDNGRTLCIDCHKKTDTYGGKINNNGNLTYV